MISLFLFPRVSNDYIKTLFQGKLLSLLAFSRKLLSLLAFSIKIIVATCIFLQNCCRYLHFITKLLSLLVYIMKLEVLLATYTSNNNFAIHYSLLK